jgi:ligand-binding sensor domain-containing protein
LSSFTRLICFFILLSFFVAVGCEEDPNPVAPPPPPQISVRSYLTLNPNPADTVTGLQNNDVYDVIVDAGGKTWVATQSGVSRYVGKTGDGVFNELNVLPNPKCRSLLSYNGKVWIGTSGGGVAVYTVATNSWSKLNADSGLVNNNVIDITGGPNGRTLYFATTNGVSIYKDEAIPMNERWRAFRTSQGLLDPVVSVIEVALTTTRGREFWYGPRFEALLEDKDAGKHGITVQREGLSQPITYTIKNSGLLEPNVNDIFFDNDTELFWIAFATKGLAVVDVDASSWTYISMAQGIPSNVTYAITKIDGAIWVGTQCGVARQLPNGTFRGYGRNGGLPGERIRSMFSNADNVLWGAIIEGGAVLLDPTSAQ